VATAPALDSKTADTLRAAMNAARAGNVAQARQLAETALDQGGDVVALNAFLGMLLARSGEQVGAIGHLRRAHEARPGDVTIACNLIAMQLEQKDLAGVLGTATRELAFADTSLRVARYRGFAAQSLDRFAEAAEAYDHVVAHQPDDFESWNNLGNARSALGDFDGSIAALQRAVALDPKAPPTRLNLASALNAAGRAAEAEQVLREAMADFPGDARPVHDLYVHLKRENRHAEALPVAEQAVKRDPDDAGLQLKFGIECGLAGRQADARQAYERAIAIDPLLRDAYLGLIIQHEHNNREEEFAPLLALAQRNGLDDGTLAFMQAFEHRRARQFGAAYECAMRVPEDIEPERTHHLRGTVLDRMERSAEAFAEFSEANRLHIANPTDPRRRAKDVRDELQSEIEQMTPDWVASWTPAMVPADGDDPVFLVGFPRSGTTLLDTILMGHPGTVVMEEQPPLNLVDKDLGGQKNLAGLDEAGLIAARDLYYREVEKIQPREPGKLLIDKSPLFLTEAPLIARLFPRARFILALRHPCDVLLSCFMSNFRLNDAMSNFLKLEDAAEFYDLVFRHWEKARALLPLNVHTIVYERLVENVEVEVRPLFDWLGLDWQDQVLDHSSTAKARGLITTASYAQVTEPIYKRSSGRWTRYREQLEPIFPILRPWIDKFGYSL